MAVALWTLAGAYAADAPVLTVGEASVPLALGLQADAAYVPDENPPTAARVALGRALYFDGRLSKDGSVSCATCHDPAHGFAEPRPTSVGVGGQVGGRNAPTVLNRLFSKEQFWDGRAADLEEQAKGPLVNPIEMAMPSHEAVVDVVRGHRGVQAPLRVRVRVGRGHDRPHRPGHRVVRTDRRDGRQSLRSPSGR